MKNLTFAFLILFLLPLKGIGQSFNPETAIKSVVQVWVTNVNGSKERKVLTGFVWKNPNQIITALHGMQAGWKIEVKYANQAAFREARVKKVLPKADLVLLELITPQSGSASILPITEAFVGKIAFEETMYCLGLAMGSSGIPSRTLSKGFLQPKETLEFLVPPNVKKELMNTSLGLDLDIIYFHNGNLLPSNSGAPIFNKQGKLVGIGNGGLEKGTVNISWAIPAKYISELENSTMTQIPGTVASNRNMFSSTVFSDEDGASVEEIISNSNQLRPILTKDFEFYLTKNRSIAELTESAEDPKNIMMLSDEIIRQYNINMNLTNIRLDIYEDIQNGIVVVVPEGLKLEVSDPGTDEESLQINFTDNEFTSLGYVVVKNDGVEDLSSMGIQEVMSFLNEYFYTELATAFQISGFSIVEEYSFADDGYDSGRKKFNIMANGAELLESPNDGRQYGILTYVTLLADEENFILTAAVTALPVDLVTRAQAYGLNCTGTNGNSEDCIRIRDFYTAFTAAHLSTFAY
jgi:hypothetical protein